MKNLEDEALTQWELHIQQTAHNFPYPPTPDLVEKVQTELDSKRPFLIRASFLPQRKLAWAILLIIVLFGTLVTMPQVRAAVLRVLRVGAITIFVSEPTPMPIETVTSTNDNNHSSVQAVGTPIESESADPLFQSIPISLAEAQQFAKHPLQLPAYPAELGLPNQLYTDDRATPSVIVSVWANPDSSQKAILSLYQIETVNFAEKGAEVIQRAIVHDNPAIWINGAHLFRLQDDQFQSWQFVNGRVLIWWAGDITWRLEGAISLEEAIRIAESLQPIE